jgi:5-methylcytosine-specific restriction endonuclease McrA
VLAIHHIDGNKQNCNPDNLITLCKSCHSRTNHGSTYWQNYLTNIVIKRT